VRSKSGKMTRGAGVVLALASGAMVVLGAVPAGAASVQYDIEFRSHAAQKPSWQEAEAETRPAADQRCVATYGFRARGVTAVGYSGSGVSGNYSYRMTWRCDSD
jgi:hypothetical protein